MRVHIPSMQKSIFIVQVFVLYSRLVDGGGWVSEMQPNIVWKVGEEKHKQ